MVCDFENLQMIRTLMPSRREDAEPLVQRSVTALTRDAVCQIFPNVR